MFKCKNCGARVKTAWQIAKHLKQKHNVIIAEGAKLFQHKCLDCNSSYRQLTTLRSHLAAHHGVVFVHEQFEWPTYKDFRKWLSETYLRKDYTYICKRSKRQTGGKCYVYNCNGGNGIFGEKVNERKKFCCTSQIRAFVSDHDGKCSVNFMKNHYGHKTEPEKLNLNPDEPQAGPSWR